MTVFPEFKELQGEHEQLSHTKVPLDKDTADVLRKLLPYRTLTPVTTANLLTVVPESMPRGYITRLSSSV